MQLRSSRFKPHSAHPNDPIQETSKQITTEHRTSITGFSSFRGSVPTSLSSHDHTHSKRSHSEDDSQPPLYTEPIPQMRSTPKLVEPLKKHHSRPHLSSVATAQAPASRKKDPARRSHRERRIAPPESESEFSSSAESSSDSDAYLEDPSSVEEEEAVLYNASHARSSDPGDSYRSGSSSSSSRRKHKDLAKQQSTVKTQRLLSSKSEPMPKAAKRRSSSRSLDEYPGSNYVYYMGQVGSKVMSDQILWKHLIIAYNLNVYPIPDFSSIPSDSINSISKCKNFIVSYLVRSGCTELCELFRSSKLIFIDGSLDFSGPIPFSMIKERQMIEVLQSETAKAFDSSALSGSVPVNSTDWLKKIGLDEYTDKFVSEGLTYVDAILKLSESDIKDLGIKVGHRSKFNEELNKLKMLQTKNEDAKSIPPETQLRDILKIDRAKDDLTQTQNEMHLLMSQMKSFMYAANAIQSEIAKPTPAQATHVSESQTSTLVQDLNRPDVKEASVKKQSDEDKDMF